jgi:acid phosphatase class B
MTQSSHLLRQILVRIESLQLQGKRGLAVFDLDSTLFDVSPRVQQILLDFAEEPLHQQLFSEQIQALKKIRTHRKDWGFQNALERAGFDGKHVEFETAVREYWHQRFFGNEYLKYDLPYDGAVEYVNDVANRGGEVVYLTGRDVQRMGSGSALTLKQWGFPLDDINNRLVLKPEKSMNDAEFKTNWFRNLPADFYEEIWFFENEPVNICHLREHLPQIKVIFFESTHAGKAACPNDIPKIVHFLMESGEEEEKG